MSKASTMFSLGHTEIFRIEETRQLLPIAALNAEPALLDANRHWLMPNFLDAEGQFELVHQTWIARVDGKIVVVDPCNGNGRTRPLLPDYNHLDTPFLERFAATGIRPEQVDYVFCTHLHCDHCGWNVQLRDGRWVPTFANARYLFVRREAQRWGARRGDYRGAAFNDGIYEECVQPVIDAGLAELVDDYHRVANAVSIEPAYGHTAGHSILRVDTGGGEIFFSGDVFHHPLQIVDTALCIGEGGDDDAAAAVATRVRLRALIAERDALMLPGHFQQPHGGRIRRSGEVFTFVPGLPTAP
ncbi:Zn-dependent hydrolase, glyoxylase [Pseudomonas sp. GM21]|uniref:MBL fold metallo-hydrolase n=1 Tax=Pseudomonas sp. GM21 TaxID=1144325 RepID=UPI00027258FB|nr:MBL fold metallo-hydrolase [Pseudomonas sp. GM21]EJM24360.1 Zn-dependent hydrolase, glyoxylase [Pseudomonas sp. GM21]